MDNTERKAEEVINSWALNAHGTRSLTELTKLLAAALRAAEDEAYERAAKIADICKSECEYHERQVIKYCDGSEIAKFTMMVATADAIGKQIRALKSKGGA